MKRTAALLTALTLLLTAPLAALGEGKGLALQEAHKVKLTRTKTAQSNKSASYLWQAATAQPAVDEEINGLAKAYADAIAPTLKEAGKSGEKNSRVDVEIRYSRTGTSWLSFMVQARTTYHRELIGQEFTTRTYDMATGERITLEDIFPEDSPAWEALAKKAEETINEYFDDELPDTEPLEQAVSREGLAQAEFTLHGMSLVLHWRAEDFYVGRHTLIEMTCMYPEWRQWMTPQAAEQTDNAALYKFAALTFDDGPARKNTTAVLENLMTAGARGTFFVIGNRIGDFPDLVQREHDEGHSIGAHNWHHGNVTKSSDSALRHMPEKVNAAMIKTIGIKVRYDRVPHGLYTRMISAGVGWAYIQWSLDTYDWRGWSTKRVMNKIKANVTDGDILLMHDIKDNTPASALAAANWLQENGYMLLTVDELFAKDGIVLEPKNVYWHNADGKTGLPGK